MARRGAFWSGAGRLNPRSGAPARALSFQASVACVLIASGSFEQLLELVSIAMIASGTLTVSALFVLRWRRPEMLRPFLAVGYPVLPLLYVISNVVVMLVMLARSASAEPGALFSAIGLFVLALTYVWHRVRCSGTPGVETESCTPSPIPCDPSPRSYDSSVISCTPVADPL